jgi:hypothetical protein
MGPKVFVTSAIVRMPLIAMRPLAVREVAIHAH